MNPRRAIRNQGFTLVELLVVVLILAILMAVALPLYLNSVKDASKKACRANMQTVSNAAQAWKVRTRALSFDGMDIDALAAASDLGAVPACPDGGTLSFVTSGDVTDGDGTTTITIPDGGFGVVCDKHYAFVPGFSHQ